MRMFNKMAVAALISFAAVAGTAEAGTIYDNSTNANASGPMKHGVMPMRGHRMMHHRMMMHHRGRMMHHRRMMKHSM